MLPFHKYKNQIGHTLFQISSAYQQHEFFYRSSAKLAEKFSGVQGETQSVRVYKDGKSYKFVDNER